MLLSLIFQLSDAGPWGPLFNQERLSFSIQDNIKGSNLVSLVQWWALIARASVTMKEIKNIYSIQKVTDPECTQFYTTNT